MTSFLHNIKIGLLDLKQTKKQTIRFLPLLKLLLKQKNKFFILFSWLPAQYLHYIPGNFLAKERSVSSA